MTWSQKVGRINNSFISADFLLKSLLCPIKLFFDGMKK